MKEHGSTGFVLSVRPLGENDLLVTLLTPDQGKLVAVAPAGRKSRKRFGGALDLFVQLSFTLVLRRAGVLPRLREAEPLELYLPLRQELSSLALASHAAECTAALLPEGDPAPEVHDLFAIYLEYLVTKGGSALAYCRFLMRLLAICGFRPQLTTCGSCGAGLPPGGPGLRVDPAHGALLCGSCGSGGQALVPPEVLHCLRAIQQREPTAGEDLPAAAAVLDSVLAGVLGKLPRSRSFVREACGF